MILLRLECYCVPLSFIVDKYFTVWLSLGFGVAVDACLLASF